MVEGKCFAIPGVDKIGQKVSRTIDNETVVIVESNNVAQVGFIHPEYAEHRTVLLNNVRLPPRMIEEFEIYQVDRRFFQGEASIKMVEKVLNIDTGLVKQYRYGGPGNNQNNFQNCHARHDQTRPSQQQNQNYHARQYAQNQ